MYAEDSKRRQEWRRKLDTNDTSKAAKNMASGNFDEQALYFHRYPRPGKLEIQATKPLGNQRDLALAYSPVSLRPASPSATTPKRQPTIRPAPIS